MVLQAPSIIEREPIKPGVVTEQSLGLDLPFAREIVLGLGGPGQKHLPASLLYDAVGSALFAAITHLDEYGLTRADARLIQRLSPQLAPELPEDFLVCELGSGDGAKTHYLLKELSILREFSYFPVDVSTQALNICIRELADIADVTVQPLPAEYLEGLSQAAAQRRPGQGLLVLFLGSTIGNFTPEAAKSFLMDVRRLLRPDDFLLLGTDLVKSTADLLAAYDDPAGVTAAFNRNVLAHLNRDYGANFDLTTFRHQARYDGDARRIEMHLTSAWRQSAHVDSLGLDLVLEEGETIWTESSYKFRLEDVTALAETSGFSYKHQWIDDEWPFAETLLIAE